MAIYYDFDMMGGGRSYVGISDVKLLDEHTLTGGAGDRQRAGHGDRRSINSDSPLNRGTSLPMYLKSLSYPPPESLSDFLRYNQYVVREYVRKHSDVRGLLIFVKMGYGKSIIAASMLDVYRKIDPRRKVVCVLAKGLITNFCNNSRKYLRASGMGDAEIDAILATYKFVSIGASNMFEQLSMSVEQKRMMKKLDISDELPIRASLDGCIVIVDEAHNLFNSIANDSSNAVRFYETVMAARDLKIFFLTGTPIVNHPHELVPCFNMLRGYIDSHGESGVRGSKQSLFPKSRMQFNKYFVDEETRSIRNKAKFQNRILGLVSYYGDYFINDNGRDFPQIVGPIVEKVHMSAEQYMAYEIARDMERDESKWSKPSVGDKFSTRSGSTSTSYRFKSRQACNFLMPEHALGPKIGFKKREDFVDRLTVSDLDAAGLARWSPKLARLSANLDRHVGTPGLIYSDFKTRDLAIIARHLELVKGFHAFGGLEHTTMSEVGGVNPTMWDTYAMLTGDISGERRDEILKVLSDLRNSDGHSIALTLVSEAGSEGVDTRGLRHVHIFGPYWNYARLQQVIFRAARYMSHAHLPEDQRNVTVYIYLSTYPLDFIPPKKLIVHADGATTVELTTDEQLYKKSLDMHVTNGTFELAMVEASIDCHIHYRHLSVDQKRRVNCHMCAPTGRPLYSASLDRDMSLPDPCVPLEEKKVSVEEIVDESGEKFYYRQVPSAAGMPEFEIYRFDADIGGHVRLSPRDPKYDALYIRISDNSQGPLSG